MGGMGRRKISTDRLLECMESHWANTAFLHARDAVKGRFLIENIAHSAIASEYIMHPVQPHTNEVAPALTVVGRTIQPRPFVIFEYYCFFDHGSVVTSGVHHENHFRFMNRKNVFFPKRKEKMDATANTRCLRSEKKGK